MSWSHIGFLVLLGLHLATPGGIALADLPVEWREGLLETSRYTILREGQPDGEIETRLYGIKGQGGGRQLRAAYDLVRKVEGEGGMEMTGRVKMEIVVDPASFNLIQRKDYYTIGDTEGRLTYTRTPRGVVLSDESAAEGILREPDERTVEFDLDGPLLDEAIINYVIRSLPLESGHTFEMSTVNPRLEEITRLRGIVRTPVEIGWNGARVEVYPVETSSSEGLATYYLKNDATHTLLRFISVTGEVYELQPEADK